MYVCLKGDVKMLFLTTKKQINIKKMKKDLKKDFTDIKNQCNMNSVVRSDENIKNIKNSEKEAMKK